MRILIVHNHYGKFAVGGEANVMAAEAALLKEHGHSVMTYERTNSEVQDAGWVAKLKTAWGSTWSRSSHDAVRRVILEFKPDIMHVHNYWLLLSPSIFAAAKECGVATVLTLHNYRLVCPGGQFLRAGKVCELCLDGRPWRAVLHRCYPGGSLLKSLLSVRLFRDTRKRGHLSGVVDAYLALSDFGRGKFIEGGLPPEKIRVKPNFMQDPCGDNVLLPQGRGAIFIGRLAPEKGLDTLLKAWRGIDYPLTVIGDGPMMERARELAPANVSFTGQLSHQEALRLCGEASMFLFTSAWYEGFPLSLLEAMATGRAIVASDLGPRRETIGDGETGLLFEAGNPEDLRRKVQLLIADPELCRRLGAAARKAYLEKYSAERNYRMLIDVYQCVTRTGTARQD
jgi:glycosyltransferase involved in cell wall biosynthesis